VAAETIPVTGATSETPYLAATGALLLLLGGVLVMGSRRWVEVESEATEDDLR
jgi:LPXTG-motif cell wall-anchored protein